MAVNFNNSYVENTKQILMQIKMPLFMQRYGNCHSDKVLSEGILL